MRVLIKFPVDVDASAYAAEFGIDRTEVREDVKQQAAVHVRNWLRTFGCLIEEGE